MGSPIKINSISIDLADAANKTDMVKCEHFSIRRFVAEACERDPKKCWPFSEKTLSLADQESFSFPLSDPKFKWWRCTSCVKDINTDETKTSDCELHSNTKTIGEKYLDGNSLVIPSKSTLNLLTVIDHEKEKKTLVAGNAVEENENAIRERSQKDDHQTATMLLKKALPRAKDASTVRSKRKLASPEQVGNKRSKEKQKVDQAVTAFGPSDIAGVVEGKATKSRKGTRVQMESDSVSSESGLQRKKTQKLRLLSDLLSKGNTNTSGGSNNNIRKEESGSKRETVRGRKRKFLPENNNVSKKLCTTSENASKSSDSDSESTDSEGLDRDPIKGKQKNRRFQVVDEFVPSSQEGIHENGVDRGKSTALTIPVQDSVPCPPPSTQRTEKKLSLAKKKTKKPVTDTVKRGLSSFSTGMDEGNQVKPRNGPLINAVSQLSTQDLLNEKRVGDDRLAAERCFIGYTPQSNGKLVICSPLQDNGHVRPRDAETNCFGSSSKSNTVGWLRSGVDVADPRSNNNNNTYRSSFTNFKQHTPTSAEVVNLSSVLQKDASGADRKGKTVMVQEHHGASGSQSQDKKANIPEEHNDDIPMEIVELMAKNQYERCLPDKEEDVSNKQPSQETGHKSKNGLLIDLNETYDNGISHEDNNTSRLPIPHGNDGNFPLGKQQKPLDFFPISKPYAPPPPPPRFGIFPSTQENRARFPGQNCQWLGNVPTMATHNPSPSPSRVLRGCNTCQSVPHQYREAAHPPIWSSAVTQPQGYHKQVSFNMDQSTRPGMPSQAPSSNGNNWNLNFVAANGKQKCVPNSEFSLGCKHAAAGTSHSSGPADAFTSESSIPAMHLLSLMNPQLRSNTPADHHVNAKFTERRFPPVNQSKGFTEFQTGDSSKPPFPTNQLPFDFGKRFAPEAPCMGFPIGQPLGTSSFSFQNAQASWSQHQHQEKRNKRKEMGPPPVYNSREKVPVFASGSNQGKFQLLGASNSMMLPLKFHVTDKDKKQKRKADSCSTASALAMKNVTTGPIECCVNRNPADFTIPEPGNVYMITGESLKIRKRAASKRKPSLCKQDALKQNKKPVAGPATENT